MKKSKVNLSNIMAYLQGNIRYKLYYSRFKFMIPTHIREQIDFRIKFMSKECYENGSCVLCGCTTTALQMANRQCDKPCYPKILNRREWRVFFKYAGAIEDEGGLWRYYSKYIATTSSIKKIFKEYPNGFLTYIDKQTNKYKLFIGPQNEQ